MKLSQLVALPAQYDRDIKGLAVDSRHVQADFVFFAVAGTQQHGRDYIKDALQKGATAVLKEGPQASLEVLIGDIPCLVVPYLSQQLGEIAARFYDYPTDKMAIIGVTGTNGKTSVTHFIAQTLGHPCGLIGTLGYGIYDHLQPGTHTTPHVIQLQALLAQLRDQQVQQVAMEVSSHGLAQGRVKGVRFQTAVFTNLSHDHLDYHHTMQAYGAAKQQLFTMPGLQTAVINYDDAFGQILLAQLPTTVTPLTYGLQQGADIYADDITVQNNGYRCRVKTPWGTGQLNSPLFGQFNLYNLLATLAVLLLKGQALSIALEKLSHIKTVLGRMEPVQHHPTVIIDYAHTPDALQQTLLALRNHCQGNLWCVFGCGGDRDASKRPLMGEVAQRYADKVVLTTDNPRHESPQAIIDAILLGCPTPTAVILERSQAIHYALQHALSPDIILIAGKGHENYQQIGEQRQPFSDKMVVAAFASGTGTSL